MVGDFDIVTLRWIINLQLSQSILAVKIFENSVHMMVAAAGKIFDLLKGLDLDCFSIEHLDRVEMLEGLAAEDLQRFLEVLVDQ